MDLVVYSQYYRTRTPEPPMPGKMTPLHSDHFNHQGA